MPSAPATPQALSAEERARAILDRVQQDGFQSIDTLAARFLVTPQTVRRDVNLLCDRGLLRRRHGGVELPPAGENLAYGIRQVLNLLAKQRIARRVAQEVMAGSSLFFGIGTTPEQCALALSGHENLRVMTNNLNVAQAFIGNPHCEVTIAGGRLRRPDLDVIAGEAHGFFSRFSVDLGIYGVAGVSEDGGLLDFSPDEVCMREALAANCRQRLLVLDHSKFGRAATVRGGHISDADTVFTDQPPPPSITRMLQAAGTRLVICDSPAPNAAPLSL